MYDFDLILERIKGFGKSQILMILAVYYFGFPSGFNSISPVFTSYSPPFRCNVPELEACDVTNFSYSVQLISPDCDTKGACNGCEMYNITSTPECTCDGEPCGNGTHGTIECPDGYVYDRSIFPETAVTEFDLVCDRIILQAVATSFYMLGLLLGSFIFGNVCDRIGRWPCMLITCVACFLTMLGAALSHTYWLYVFFRVLVSFFGYGTTIATFVYVMEIVGLEYRTLVGISFQISFAIGYMTMSGLAYAWPDWHNLQFACLVLSIPFGVFVLLLPESPRWLLAKGNDEKGMKITNWMAKLNNRQMSDEDWENIKLASDKLEKTSTDGERKYSTKDLFRTPGIKIVTLGVMFNWFVNSLVYYGVTLNTGSLSGDIFVNNVLGGLVEIIGYILVILFMERLGRRTILCVALCIAGAALLLCAVLGEYSEDNEAMQVTSKIFAFIGKMGISGSYAIIYNFTSELFPTVVRSNGIGTGSIAARIGGMLAPFIIIIQVYVSWLPNVLFGVLSLVAAGLCLLLPETTGCGLMETIEEAEEFYAGKRKKAEQNGITYENFEKEKKKATQFENESYITEL